MKNSEFAVHRVILNIYDSKYLFIFPNMAIETFRHVSPKYWVASPKNCKHARRAKKKIFFS